MGREAKPSVQASVADWPARVLGILRSDINIFPACDVRQIWTEVVFSHRRDDQFDNLHPYFTESLLLVIVRFVVYMWVKLADNLRHRFRLHAGTGRQRLQGYLCNYMERF